jgi:type I restriction enzyme, S subunit
MQKVTEPKTGYKNVKNYFKKNIEIPESWDFPIYEDILEEVENPVTFSDDEEYKLIKVKRRHRGATLRETLRGKDILTKKLYSVNAGDFIMSKMQIIHGSCDLVPKYLEDGKISGSYLRFKAKKGLNLEYLNWFSQTPFFAQQTFVSSVGSNLEKMNFNKEHWLRLSIPLPPIEEQNKIVKILNHVLDIINLTQQRITQTNKSKKGLRKKLLTKGIKHQQFKKRELFFETINVPSCWKWDKLTNLFDLRSGSTPSRSNPDFFKGNIPWVASGDLNRGVIKSTVEEITQEAINEKTLTVYPKGTFLIAIYGLEAAGTRGKFGILDMDATINQACMALIGNNINIEFFSYFYEEFGEKIAFSFAQGTKQQNLSEKTLKFLDVPIPLECEQEEIVLILSKFDTKINMLKLQKLRLIEIKKGLMQKLLTGTIQVKV